MNRYVLDTDHLSLLYRGDAAVSANVSSQDPLDLAISIVSVEESLSGWYAMLRRARHPGELERTYESLERSMSLLCRFTRIPFNQDAAVLYVELQGRRTGVGRMDLRIAASVIAQGDVLVTRNVRDFGRVPELRLADWSRA